MERAIGLYPNNKMLWHTRMEMAAFEGDVGLTERIAEDLRGLHDQVRASDIDLLVEVARAVSGKGGRSVDAVQGALMERAPHHLRSARNAMRFASIMGRSDESFAIADAYYFGRGFTISGDLGSGLYVAQNQRHTNYLFEPPMAPMRRDDRFRNLCAELGLSRYWQKTGNAPLA